jgi:ATP-dependent helicase/nuclease subunit B
MSAGRSRPRVFNIPAGAPFLSTLADAILSGRLVELPADDPLALADLTILLPTRRAVRAMREVFVTKVGGKAAILPIIRTIGDVDEEDHLLAVSAEASADLIVLPEAISRLSRHLYLTQLTLAWGKTVRREKLKIGASEPLLIPASAADAARLARDLAGLMDDLATAGISFDKLRALAGDDATGYFRITLDSLQIVSEHWPQILAAQNRVDPASRRDHLIRAEASRLREAPPARPIVAAGSTGSIPATAELLKAIAGLPNGAVVLPGLDMTLDDAAFAAITGEKASAFGHPQYGIKKLIEKLQIARDDVEPLVALAPSFEARSEFLSEALRPAETTESWAGFRSRHDDATIAAGFADVGFLVARNEQEEALAIALAFREAVEKGTGLAALVTPDRTLARRVAVELGRWNLAVDDSAGAPLASLPQGIFAMQLVEAVVDCDPVALLALLSHPLSAFGMDRARCRRAARILELALLRGDRVHGGLAALSPALAAARGGTADPAGRHVARARRSLSGADWREADALVAALIERLAPAEALLRRGAVAVPLKDFAATLLAVLRSAATDETGSDALLWRGPEGEALAKLLEGLIKDESKLVFPPQEAPPLLRVLLGDVAVSRPVGAETRIHIWGALEARLQSVDFLVLCGLDEGVWPGDTRTDPWLSRMMRSEVGLEPPERRIGLSAHDFAQGFAAPRVLVTRAEKRGGSPTVASRWLQRLTALLGKERTKSITDRGGAYVALSRRIDAVGRNAVTPAPRPAPTPPLAARPKSLSITEIETLVRDPYAIYARRVLKLEPLDPLGLAPDYALRGTLIHDALGKFTQQWERRPHDGEAEKQLLAIGDRILESIAEFPDVHAVWSHRFRAIARWFIAFERDRDAEIDKRNAEIDGKFSDPELGDFRLTGRADRIDLRQDGRIDILDFKTGTPPSARQVLSGLSPQLALEGGMATAGFFGEHFARRSVAELAWLGLSRVGRGEVYKSAVEKEWTADQLGAEAIIRFKALILAYADATKPYLSRARPQFETRYESPYDHLARVREWSMIEAEEDEL